MRVLLVVGGASSENLWLRREDDRRDLIGPILLHVLQRTAVDVERQRNRRVTEALRDDLGVDACFECERRMRVAEVVKTDEGKEPPYPFAAREPAPTIGGGGIQLPVTGRGETGTGD